MGHAWIGDRLVWTDDRGILRIVDASFDVVFEEDVGHCGREDAWVRADARSARLNIALQTAAVHFADRQFVLWVLDTDGGNRAELLSSDPGFARFTEECDGAVQFASLDEAGGVGEVDSFELQLDDDGRLVSLPPGRATNTVDWATCETRWTRLTEPVSLAIHEVRPEATAWEIVEDHEGRSSDSQMRRVAFTMAHECPDDACMTSPMPPEYPAGESFAVELDGVRVTSSYAYIGAAWQVSALIREDDGEVECVCHQGAGNPVVWSPDGRYVVVPTLSSSFGESFRLFQVPSLKEVTPDVAPPGWGPGPGTASFDPAARQLAMIDDEGWIWVYARGNRDRFDLEERHGPQTESRPTAIAMLGTDRAAVLHEDGTLAVRYLDTGRYAWFTSLPWPQRSRDPGGFGEDLALVPSADGEVIAVLDGPTIQIVQAATGALLSDRFDAWAFVQAANPGRALVWLDPLDVRADSTGGVWLIAALGYADDPHAGNVALHRAT